MIHLILVLTLLMRQEPLKVGDRVPYFTLSNEAGKEIAIKDHIGHPLVIYFYPKDDTPGCTREACSFRDHYEEFEEIGARIFGISSDSPESHKAFKEKYQLPYSLLSDSEKIVQKLFGVKKNFLGLIDGRVTYVVDRNGIVVHIFDSQLQPRKHIKEALDILKTLPKR